MDYKIKLVHLLSNNDEVEKKSIQGLKKLVSLSEDKIRYIQHVNAPYDGAVPKETCSRPGDIRLEPGDGVLCSRHYGCYAAFRRAIEEEFTPDVDFFMICERDCYLEISNKEFLKLLDRCCDYVLGDKIDYFSFGDMRSLITTEKVSWVMEQKGEYQIVNRIWGCQMIMFPQSFRQELLEILSKEPWDVSDIFFNTAFAKYNKRLGIVAKRAANQLDGESLINKRMIFNLSNDSQGKGLLALYEKTPLVKRHKKAVMDLINVTFIGTPKVEIIGKSTKSYLVEFVDPLNNQIVYSSTIGVGQFATCFRQWFTPWEIRVNGESYHKYDAKGKRILIVLDSSALGDTICWFQYVEEFQKKHDCEVIVSTFWNKLFEKNYPNITFVTPGSTVHNLYAAYYVGCWDANFERNKRDWRTIPLQAIASDILGLEFEERRPRIVIPKKGRPIKSKYVCIAEHSTMQAKYWNYPGGWQIVVDYLKSLGYEVMVVSKEATQLKGIIDRTGSPIESTLVNLKYCEFYVGLGHGVSWVSWALNKHVVMIVGFSNFCEFRKNNHLVNPPPGTCTGCFNEITHTFDRSWWACPNKQEFICTKSILPVKVIERIDEVIKLTSKSGGQN
jgi:autotransporter strand-loop-strand O-heptosyltransferase